MNEVILFTNTQFGEVRTLTKDGGPWFVAADICRALDHSNVSMALSRLDEDEKAKFSLGLSGGDTNCINESGLYALVLGSRKSEARSFKRWITHEVIPAIRKHGIYATSDVIDHIIANPDYGIRLLSELKAEREHVSALEETTARQERLLMQMRPKVTYLDLILQNRELIPITAIAKDYGMSGRAMNRLLHSLGIQYRINSMWVLYQQHADLGYTHSMTERIYKDKIVMYTCWTQKGRLFLYNLLKERLGMLPVIEREGIAQ